MAVLEEAGNWVAKHPVETLAGIGALFLLKTYSDATSPGGSGGKSSDISVFQPFGVFTNYLAGKEGYVPDFLEFWR